MAPNASSGAVRPGCLHCGSPRVTALSMVLTDGSRVDFASCRRCEGKSWLSDGLDLPLTTVLDRARRH